MRSSFVDELSISCAYFSTSCEYIGQRVSCGLLLAIVYIVGIIVRFRAILLCITQLQELSRII